MCDRKLVAEKIEHWANREGELPSISLSQMPFALSAIMSCAMDGKSCVPLLQQLDKTNDQLLGNLAEFSSFDEAMVRSHPDLVWELEDAAWKLFAQKADFSDEKRFERRMACSRHTVSWLFNKASPDVSEWKTSNIIHLLSFLGVDKNQLGWERVVGQLPPMDGLPSWSTVSTTVWNSYEHLCSFMCSQLLDKPQTSANSIVLGK